MNRRDILLAAGAAAIAGPAGARAAALPATIRIGYQKSSVLALAKQQRRLETRFAPQGAGVQWVEFNYGPPLLEALGAGRLDYGYSGNAPPIFAQAARAAILYVAAMPAHGDNVGIVVPQGSPIAAVADLRGRTVGVARGSSAHDLLVGALDIAGVPYEAIKATYLVPADAASAFARGAIEAWAIWDPFFAIAETAGRARALDVGAAGASQNTFFLANRAFAAAHPDAVKAINEEVAAATAYAGAHKDEAAALFAAATGVEIAAQTRATARTTFAVTPVTEAILAQQQGVADRFARLKLIPAPIAVRDLLWSAPA